MGVLINWEKQSPASNYDKAVIERSTDEEDWEEITEVDIYDYVYYDSDGGSNFYYRLKFKDSDSGTESGYSNVISGEDRELFSNPIIILETMGEDPKNPPDFLPYSKLYEIIKEVGHKVEGMCKTVFGRKKEFEEYFSTVSTMGPDGRINTYKYLSDLEVFKRYNFEGDWYKMREYYDYGVMRDAGVLRFYWRPYNNFYVYDYEDLKVTGSYGMDKVPEDVKYYVHLEAVQRAILLKEVGDTKIKEYTIGEMSYRITSSDLKDLYKKYEMKKSELIENSDILGESNNRVLVV